MTEAAKRAVFDPDTFVEGGGLFDNVDGVIKDFKFTEEAPNENYKSDGSPIFALLTLLLAGSGSEQERTVSQSYSLGATAGQNYKIVDNGYGLEPIVNSPILRKGTKFDILMASLKKLGVKPSGSLKDYLGINAHWKRTADPVRNFRKANEKEKKYPETTLIAESLLSGSQPATGGGGASGEASIDDLAVQYLTDVVAKGPVQRGRLILAVSKAAAKEPAGTRTKITNRIKDESFLIELAAAGIVNYEPDADGQPVSAAA